MVTVSSGQESKVVILQTLLNGLLTSVKNIVPNILELERPRLLGESIRISQGVIVGTIGDCKGNILISGEKEVFNRIAQTMYGMQLEGEMLSSFIAELSNMIAGSFSTIVEVNGISIDITSPTLLEGDVVISGYHKAILMKCHLIQDDHFDIVFSMEETN
ncbi:chemotaxis protein CheX [Chungangia koreensis]|uniref:Chemotaxis protein CheX n=1 Tax=Chungangia koreensis TaxID=752657 RepID=A0ABV8X8G4_9LACT